MKSGDLVRLARRLNGWIDTNTSTLVYDSSSANCCVIGAMTFDDIGVVIGTAEPAGWFRLVTNQLIGWVWTQRLVKV